MAVFWLVLDCVKAKAEWAQSLLLLRASGGQFNVYARRYRRAKQFFESFAWLSQLELSRTKDRRSPPQTTEEASHASLRSARRLRDEKPAAPSQNAAAALGKWAALRAAWA